MARDRKRAKQRQQRRARQQQSGSGDANRAQRRPKASQGDDDAPEVVDENEALEAPEPLEHASADADEAAAAFHGDPAEAGIEDRPLDERDFPHEDELEGIEGDDASDASSADVDAQTALGRPSRRERKRGSDSTRPREGGTRFGNFLKACWAELRRVQWPDRRQVTQATGVVLGFVVLAGGYLGLSDAVFSRLVEAIL